METLIGDYNGAQYGNRIRNAKSILRLLHNVNTEREATKIEVVVREWFVI